MTGAILKISPEKSLELRYTARRAERLEAELNESLLMGLAKIDRVGVLAKYIAFGADIPLNDAYDAYDEYVDNGGTMDSASDVIVEAMEKGGFISRSAIDAAKKVRGQLLKAPRS